MSIAPAPKRKRKVVFRRKRSLDPSIIIDYKRPDSLKRFVTDRGKIIPRRISGATSKQQRQISLAIKRARYLALLPFSIAHKTERGFSGEMSMAFMSGYQHKERFERPSSHHQQQQQNVVAEEGGADSFDNQEDSEN